MFVANHQNKDNMIVGKWHHSTLECIICVLCASTLYCLNCDSCSALS